MWLDSFLAGVQCKDLGLAAHCRSVSNSGCDVMVERLTLNHALGREREGGLLQWWTLPCIALK